MKCFKRVVLACALLLTLQPARAAEWVVTRTYDDGAGTLRDAIRQAASGDTIRFRENTNYIFLTSQIDINKNLTLQGRGAPYLTIYAPGSRVFRVRRGATVQIRAMTLRGLLVTSNGKNGREGNSSEAPTAGANATTAYGGAIFNEGSLKLINCVVRESVCKAGDGGAGGSFISDPWDGGSDGARGGNGGAAYGGAIYNAGEMTLDGCTFTENSAQGGQGGEGGDGTADIFGENGNGGRGGNGGFACGGVIFNAGTGAIINCTFSGNSAHGGFWGDGGTSGGGAYPGGAGDARGARGGAIYNMGTLNVISNTITKNFVHDYFSWIETGAGLGGGIFNLSGTGTVRPQNSIIAGNTSDTGANDVFGSFASQGFNLIGNGEGVAGFDKTGDRSGTQALPLDARLGPLTYNGGLTPTHDLLSTSPALDSGLSNGLGRDQRGQRRPRDLDTISNAPEGDGADKGAVEFTNVAPTTLTVNTLDDHSDGACTTEDCSLRDAVSAAFSLPGTQTINFADTVRGVLTLTRGLVNINSSVAIQGPGRNLLTISGNNQSSILWTNAPELALSGLNFVRGADSALWILRGNVTIRDCAFANNLAGYGSAIRNDGTLTVYSTTFRNNGTNTGYRGGAIYNNGPLEMAGCLFADNKSSEAGGAILNAVDGTATLNFCRFLRNRAITGGAIYHANDFHRLSIANSVFDENIAGSGGAIFSGAEAVLSNCRFTSNKATALRGEGGAIAGLQLLTLLDCFFGGNVSRGQGGAVSQSFGSAVINRCVFDNNNAGLGGALEVRFQASAKLESCRMRGNSAREGGAILNDGSLDVRRTSLSGNRAEEGVGGALFIRNSAIATFAACSLWDNYATSSGGAVLNRQGTVKFYNSTLAQNKAGVVDTDASGGAVYNTGFMSFKHCTITENQAPNGGGLANASSGHAYLNNTILAVNRAPLTPDAAGVFLSQNFNLIGIQNGSSGFTKPGDRAGSIQAPLAVYLSPRDDIRGRYYLPQNQSPALDAGTSSGSGADQLGHARPLDFPDIRNAPGSDGSDIGAIEVGGAVAPFPTPTRTPPPPPF